jgi:carbon-monoxide dehydrogenase medium subunit
MTAIIAQGFTYHAPRSQDELVDLLADHEAVKLLAGGTDLFVEMRNGLTRPQAVVDIKKVAGYRDISWDDEAGLSIGPGVTINELLRSPLVGEHHPLLVACGEDLASYQIRNRATVAGNVVNASPCADMAPGLLCSRAVAVVVSRGGEHTVPFSEFFTGVKRTVLKPDEVLARIVVPAETAGARGSYRKLKRIKGHDLGIVGVAVWKKDGLLRLGISSSAPTPLVIDGLHESDSVDDILGAVRAAIRPISDVRCTAEYRSHMVQVFTRKLLEEVA